MTRQEHLLVCLMEEAAEIQHAISKVLRFGPEQHYPETGIKNDEQVGLEIDDFIAIYRLLHRDGTLRATNDLNIRRKQAKVLDLMERLGVTEQ